MNFIGVVVVVISVIFIALSYGKYMGARDEKEKATKIISDLISIEQYKNKMLFDQKILKKGDLSFCERYTLDKAMQYLGFEKEIYNG